ncbi:hypothetical protein M408DRAFT_230798 [Serendipita vermifera MAFF 305830]|uniref:Uncharacterized protein n=1 Tax=Serendipita vermifera MAFF 305830 TaxID=933852 RepID=A0A0C3AJE5_SERVB|nr:hypothetical protein M408DRAFT_230798 [Serendipita vermifera MAFF 305830]
MGFFSFGKKKKPVETTNRPSKLVASASASSSLSAASSGSSGSASPPQLPPKRSQTTPAGPRTLSFRPDTVLHPVPKIPGAISQSSSSSSLNVPNAPYSRDLNKKGSTHTLNSIKSTASGSGRRGAHEAPRIAPELAAWTAKPRASSYHASQVRNIWVTSASETGHAASAVQVNITPTTTKYYSTGSPGVMNRGSYFNAIFQSPSHVRRRIQSIRKEIRHGNRKSTHPRTRIPPFTTRQTRPRTVRANRARIRLCGTNLTQPLVLPMYPRKGPSRGLAGSAPDGNRCCCRGRLDSSYCGCACYGGMAVC